MQDRKYCSYLSLLVLIATAVVDGAAEGPAVQGPPLRLRFTAPASAR